MTNREENLKKINAELEQLSDEELEQVSGGSIGQTTSDSKFLYDYGLVDDYHGNFHSTFHWLSDSAAVDGGWSKAGITCVTAPWGDNQYFMNGKEITRDEAYDVVRANFTRIHNVYSKPPKKVRLNAKP